MSGRIEKISEPSKVSTPTDGEFASWSASPVALGERAIDTARSLHRALYCKDPGTAAHSTRVMRACLGWFRELGLDAEASQLLEMGALLHDVGKLAVPNEILHKSSSLSEIEQRTFDRGRLIGLEMMRNAIPIPELEEIYLGSHAWFDGSRYASGAAGQSLTVESRMLAIVDAFDAMTTERAYRPAMERDRALDELHRFAGSQFDPELVQLFVNAAFSDPELLREVDDAGESSLVMPSECRVVLPGDWGRAGPPSLTLFQRQFLDNMRDAIAFVNQTGHIVLWNAAAEALTGIERDAICGRPWTEEIIQILVERDATDGNSTCPVQSAISKGEIRVVSCKLRGKGGRIVPTELSSSPVLDEEGKIIGASVQFRDVTSEHQYRAQCQTLNKKAKTDPLTGVANRGHFDRVHAATTTKFAASGRMYSVILCDLDHFKSVNDTLGHQAGDHVLKSIAELMSTQCRSEDLVARYGGEEFVILCPDSDGKSATARAETMRAEFARTSGMVVAGRQLTASFGVAELEPGDCPADLLSRADKALYRAKRDGRDRVVFLSSSDSAPRPSTGNGHEIASQRFAARIPLSLLRDRLRGMAADERGKVCVDESDHMEIVVDRRGWLLRRPADRHVPLSIEIRIEERQDASAEAATIMTVTIRTQSHRERRLEQARDRARQLLSSVRAFTMATEVDSARVD